MQLVKLVVRYLPHTLSEEGFVETLAANGIDIAARDHGKTRLLYYIQGKLLYVCLTVSYVFRTHF